MEQQSHLGCDELEELEVDVTGIKNRIGAEIVAILYGPLSSLSVC